MRLFTRLGYASVLLAVLTSPAFGETVKDATNQYFAVMKSEDYVAVAALFDPVELKTFRDSFSFLSDLSPGTRSQLYESLFGQGSTEESIAQFSDRQFFAAIFAVSMRQSNMSEMIRFAETEYLGHIMEGDDTAHAVTRMFVNTSEFSFENLSVASFVRRGDAWKMKMSGDVRSVAQNIQRALGQSQ